MKNIFLAMFILLLSGVFQVNAYERIYSLDKPGHVVVNPTGEETIHEVVDLPNVFIIYNSSTGARENLVCSGGCGLLCGSGKCLGKKSGNSVSCECDSLCFSSDCDATISK